MLNRRHLRIKVLQILYAFFQSEEENILKAEKELLSAVEFAHNKGIVHRDIKPDNIMLTRAGKVKVLDFGIARAVAETFDDIATTTSILGTAAYFSPEQAQGRN